MQYYFHVQPPTRIYTFSALVAVYIIYSVCLNLAGPYANVMTDNRLAPCLGFSSLFCSPSSMLTAHGHVCYIYQLYYTDSIIYIISRNHLTICTAGSYSLKSDAKSCAVWHVFIKLYTRENDKIDRNNSTRGAEITAAGIALEFAAARSSLFNTHI